MGRESTGVVRCVLPVCLLLPAAAALADGGGIDKVYHPYVQALEREVELRASIEDGDNPHSADRQTWRLGYGQAVGDSWFGEVYLVGERHAEDKFDLKGYEVEALWQLAEQGEYAVDSGLMFELEHNAQDDYAELATILLLEKAIGHWSTTANLSLSYEFGSDIHNELETAVAVQLRYRHTRALEPGVEFYSSEDVRGLGPVLLGDVRFGAGRQLHWEAGMIVGLISRTPDRTFRLALEYEF